MFCVVPALVHCNYSFVILKYNIVKASEICESVKYCLPKEPEVLSYLLTCCEALLSLNNLKVA